MVSGRISIWRGGGIIHQTAVISGEGQCSRAARRLFQAGKGADLGTAGRQMPLPFGAAHLLEVGAANVIGDEAVHRTMIQRPRVVRKLPLLVQHGLQDADFGRVRPPGGKSGGTAAIALLVRISASQGACYTRLPGLYKRA